MITCALYGKGVQSGRYLLLDKICTKIENLLKKRNQRKINVQNDLLSIYLSDLVCLQTTDVQNSIDSFKVKVEELFSKQTFCVENMEKLSVISALLTQGSSRYPTHWTELEYIGDNRALWRLCTDDTIIPKHNVLGHVIKAYRAFKTKNVAQTPQSPSKSKDHTDYDIVPHQQDV